MNQKSFLQIFALCAFVVLMGISCWATVESLHLLLPTWPIIFFWAVSVIFFVVASIGSKLIVDSFNQQIRVDNRSWRLISGIVLLLLFWVCFSLPTSTHTFFYRATIKDVAVQDIKSTTDKLRMLLDDGVAKTIVDQDKADFRAEINRIFTNFSTEINSPGNEGWKDRAEKVIIELEGKLGKIQRIPLRDNSFQGRQKLIEAMRKQVDELTESHIKSVYDPRLRALTKGYDKKVVAENIKYFDAVINDIKKNPKSVEPTPTTARHLSEAYITINERFDVIKKEIEKDNPKRAKDIESQKILSKVSETERMLSVVDVWKDFFNGRFAGRGFIFWIMLAALVDIAGFIFFDIAFARRKD